jgi:ABC-2 type transport system permease protein
MIEAIRGLLLGTSAGNSVVLAVAWSIAFVAVGYLWAMRRYDRAPGR